VDVDISEMPLSFQIGLNDHLELFFTTDAYRGVKVNSPRNLSSLYLPNAQFFSAPAIVLTPNGLAGGQFAGRPVFRPAGNQPFVPFPFIGGSAGHFGYPPGVGPLQSGNPTLGVSGGGAANNFPGIGSIYGSILPGVVLTTVNLPVGPLGGPGNTAPGIFATAPSYLPDAPLIGVTYGESSFNSYTFGGKWRWTGPNNPIGVGILGYYRYYQDRPDSADGFKQLQDGAGAGSKRGDIGVSAFADARVRSWMNISANVGYQYSGDIEADLPGGSATLLDRGDELTAAFGLDFPVNKYFQPILEFRSLQYVGGRTPNAFENNPLDGLAGARVFIRSWVGFSAAYRHHFNPQSRDSFDDTSFTSNVVVPCFFDGGGAVTTGEGCTPIVINRSFTGVPEGFRTSSDPHGFMFQFFAGRRNARAIEEINKTPTINSIELSDKEIKLPCPAGEQPAEGESCSDNQSVTVRTNATDPENDVLTYNYTVSGGRIDGQGANVTWDLSGVSEGTYTITATIDDGCGVCAEPKTETVTVVSCNCVKPPECECGDLSVTGPPAAVAPGETMTFTAEVTGSTSSDITYNWSVDKGSIISGQGTPSITVSTDGLGDETLTATVNTQGSGDCASCNLTGSETGIVAKPTEEPRFFDEFGKVPNNEVRKRIDLFFVELQNDPSSTGYIVNYGSSREITRRERLIRNQATLRNLPIERIVFVNGGVESEIRTRLWIVPAGADPSTVNE